MITYNFYGRLGNICWEIATVFDYCHRFNIPEHYIVFNKNHKDYHWNYDLTYYSDFFRNIADHFVDQNTFKKLTANNKIETYNSQINYGTDVSFNEWSDDLGIVLKQSYTKDLFRRLFRNESLCDMLQERYSNIFNAFYTIGIHIRRTDYIEYFHNYEFKDPNNIIRRVQQIIANNVHKKFKILVFSDDINWVKNVLLQFQIHLIYVENNKDFEDLLLMTLCNEIVSVGSSFSDTAKLIK